MLQRSIKGSADASAPDAVDFLVWKGAVKDPYGIYRSSTLDGSNWEDQQKIAGVGTNSRPALVAFQGRLYMAWRGTGSDPFGIYWSSSLSGSDWTEQKKIADVGTSAGPALVVFQGRLYMFWKGAGDDFGIYWSWTLDGTNWEPQQKVPNVGTSSGPALAVFQNRLHMVWKGAGNDPGIYWSSTLNGSDWENQQKLKDITTSAGPALAFFQGLLYMAWKSADNSRTIYWGFSSNGLDWVGMGTVSPALTDDSPALSAFRDRLYLVWMGIDQGIWSSSFDGKTWAPQAKIRDFATSTGPALAVKTPTSAAVPPYQTRVNDVYSGYGITTCTNLPQISFSGSTQFTFEAWLNFDALADQMNFVSREGEFVFGSLGGRLYAARESQTVPVVSDLILEHHTWYHVAVTYNGLNMRLWLNGVPVSTVTAPDSGVSNKGHPMTIGGGLYGQVRMVRMWNILVTPSDLYANQFLLCPTGTQGLVAQLVFSTLPATDTSGNNVPCTVSESGVRLLRLSPTVQLQGDGFCDPYNDNQVNPSGSSDFTVMSWLYPHDTSKDGVVFSNGSLGSGTGTAVTIQPGGTIKFSIGNVSIASKGTVPVQTWKNVVCTWQVSSGTAAIWIDGALDSKVSGVAGGSAPLTGAPLIGATASRDSAVPINGLVGAIQSVSVWPRVLNDGEIRRYVAPKPPDPVQDITCVADYDFSNPPAQNSMALNLVGLVGTTALANVEEYGPRTSSETGGGEATPSDITTSAIPAAQVDELRSHLLSPAEIEAFEGFVRALGLEEEQVRYATQRYRDNVERGAADARAGKRLVSWTFDVEDQGSQRVLSLRDGERKVEVYRGDLDSCTTWAIGFIITLVGTLWMVLGFTINFPKAIAGITNFLGQRINTVGLLPQLRAVFRNGVTAKAVYQAAKLLHEFGLLAPIGKLLWQAVRDSLTIFTILSVGIRIALLFSPYAPLEIAVFVAELGYSLYQLIQVWNSPDNCWRSQSPA